MSKIESIYNSLYSHFAPQRWWPVTEEGRLHPEYSGGPKSEKQQLEVCFGAILTQNTSWKNVEKAIYQLNKNRLIDVHKILKIKNKRLAQIIRSSGYHNQKAKKLKNFCEFLLKCQKSEISDHDQKSKRFLTNYNGKLGLLFKNDIEELRKQLLSVNGIGPETADSIILYAAKKPIFVVDAYTKRIFSRIGCKEKTYDEFQKLFMSSLPNSERLFNECHALIVELGKNICKKSPLCGKCPINVHCDYYKKEKINYKNRQLKW